MKIRNYLKIVNVVLVLNVLHIINFIFKKGYISNYNGDIINHKNVKTIDAQDLRTGMKIIKCDYPVINTKKLQHAYTNGIFSGDGTYTNCGAEEQPCKFKSLEGKSYCKKIY